MTFDNAIALLAKKQPLSETERLALIDLLATAKGGFETIAAWPMTRRAGSNGERDIAKLYAQEVVRTGTLPDMDALGKSIFPFLNKEEPELRC